VKTWHYLVIGAAVVWYITERERQAIAIEANKQATGVLKKTGEGLGNVVGEGAAAVGRFFGGLFKDKPATSSSSSPTSSPSSNSGSPATRPDSDYWEDLADAGVPSWGDSNFTG
jgi:hypothetical protein